MKNFLYYLLIVLSVSQLMASQEVPNDFDICNENNGNIQIKSIVRWGSVWNRVFLFTQNGQVIYFEKFEWNPVTKQMTFEGIKKVNPQSWNTTEMKFVFDVEYPSGDKLVKVDRGQMHSIAQLKASWPVVNAWTHEVVTSPPLSINIYTCGSKPEEMNLCSLFGKFPQATLQTSMISITSFPRWGIVNDSDIQFGLPFRFFVYFKEIPVRPNDCVGCYQSKRFIVIGQRINFTETENKTWNWHIDNTTDSQCIDLNGVIVNSSISLTKYLEDEDEDIYRFDLVEFSGTEYTVYRISLNAEKVLDPDQNFEKIASGPIAQFFNCIKPTTQPTDSTTQPTQPPDGPKTEGPEGVRPQRPGVPETGGPSPSISVGGQNTTQKMRTTPQSTSEPSTGFSWFWIILVILLLLIVIGVIAWFFIPRGGGEGAAGGGADATPPPTTPSPPASPPGATVDISEAEVTPTPSDTKTIRTQTPT